LLIIKILYDQNLGDQFKLWKKITDLRFL